MKLIITKGATSVSVNVFIRDNSVTTGAGLTGLAYNTGSLTAYYVRQNGTATAITLATQTATGAYSSGGFVAVDGTNMPGLYRLDIPDAVLASGVDWAYIMLKGAANMEPCVLEIELTSVNLQDTVRAGLTALPNVASGNAGAIITSGTGTAQLSVTSGRANADVTHIATAAVSTSTAQLGVNVVNFGGSAGTFASGRPEVNTTHVAGTAQTAKDIGAAVPAAAAGASGGLLISGSNSGTTTLGALTVTGATTLTGAVTATSGTNDVRINGVAAGGSGGVLISGSNSGTTTLGALTVTGATTLTGAVTGTNAGNDLRLATTVRSGTGTGELSLSSGAIKVQAGIRKNQALANFPFLMTDSTNHNPATGLTVTATRSIDGGAFASGTITNMTEVSNGVYQCDLGAGDLNGDTIALRFTATGADDLIVTLITEP